MRRTNSIGLVAGRRSRTSFALVSALTVETIGLASAARGAAVALLDANQYHPDDLQRRPRMGARP